MNKKTEYISNYNKRNYKTYLLRVNVDNKKLIEHLDNYELRNSYICGLIEKDMNRPKLTIKRIRELVVPVLSKYNIKEIYLFGSYAREEANCKSDVDILCDKGKIKSLIEESHVQLELEKVLKSKVDLIFKSAIHDEYFYNTIKEDLIPLC